MNALTIDAPGTRPTNDSLVESYRDLVRRVAARLRRRIPTDAHLEFDDLVGAGYLGLLEAAERFDWLRPSEFATFAEFRIKGAMLDELRRVDPMPRRRRRALRELNEARATLASELSREPSRSEVARVLRWNTSEVRTVEVAREVAHPVSTDQADLAPSNAPTADRLALARECQRKVAEAVTSLPERERDIVRSHFFEEISVTDIAGRLGLTKGRISQLKSVALSRMRTTVGVTASGAYLATV